MSADTGVYFVSDKIIEHRGTAILAETAELIGAGHLLVKRAVDEQVGERIFSDIVSVSCGKLTKAEVLKQDDFGIWRIGPTF